MFVSSSEANVPFVWDLSCSLINALGGYVFPSDNCFCCISQAWLFSAFILGHTGSKANAQADGDRHGERKIDTPMDSQT